MVSTIPLGDGSVSVQYPVVEWKAWLCDPEASGSADENCWGRRFDADGETSRVD